MLRFTAHPAHVAILVAAVACNVLTTTAGERTGSPTFARSVGETDTARILRELDLRAAAAASARSHLQLPLRIGVARMENGVFTPMPAGEWNSWLSLRRSLDPQLATLSPVTSLVAQSLTPEAVSPTPHAALSNIRLAGAREHLDAVLVYDVSVAGSVRDTEVTLLDATILGAWLFPTHRSHLTASTSAALIDVRSGLACGSAVAVAEDDCSTTLLGSGEKRFRQREHTVNRAVARLAPEVAAVIQRLASGRATSQSENPARSAAAAGSLDASDAGCSSAAAGDAQPDETTADAADDFWTR